MDMEKIFEKRWVGPVIVLLLILAVFIAYSNTIHWAFQFDDETIITKNLSLRDLSNLPVILKGARGLTMATFALNYAAGGFDTTGYHLVNISIHAVNSVLAYLLILNILKLTGAAPGRSRKIAAFAALIFALHPVQIQAVTYIVQRMESLAGLFFLLGVLFFSWGATAQSPIRRFLLYFFVPVLYVLGFYSKEVAITLPAVILLYDFYFVSKGKAGGVLGRWPLYLVLAVLLAFFAVNTVVPKGGFNDMSKEASMAVQAPAKEGTAERERPRGLLKKVPTAGFGVTSMTPWEYFLTQSNVVLYYYSLLLVPVNQNVDYDFPISRGLFETPRPRPGAVLNIWLPPPVVSILIHISIIVLAGFLFMRSRNGGDQRWRVVSFFIFWFFILLAPTSSFVPIVDVIFEHRLYLSTLAYSVILVLCLEALLKRLLGPGDAGTKAR
ncbi:MAG: hypothetical protein BMS9Abin23_1080 [Thermodesulfobacteriota bacterium]|nr:MAG: hypothetical protein BMS9Abin23_1080 [Thermodesulfobacteriota bacterium]